MPLESTGTGGATIYLRIQDVDNGNQCMDGFRLPGDSSFKTDTLTDLNKLLNVPYGESSKYWMQFGGFGIAASTPFTGCIDDHNQQYIEVTDEDTGILKFSGIQVNYTLIDYRLGQIKFFSIYRQRGLFSFL